MCAHTAVYRYVCPHNADTHISRYICVLILLYIAMYDLIMLISLDMCAHTAVYRDTHVSSSRYMCPHLYTCVLIQAGPLARYVCVCVCVCV